MAKIAGISERNHKEILKGLRRDLRLGLILYLKEKGLKAIVLGDDIMKSTDPSIVPLIQEGGKLENRIRVDFGLITELPEYDIRRCFCNFLSNRGYEKVREEKLMGFGLLYMGGKGALEEGVSVSINGCGLNNGYQITSKIKIS